MDDFILRNHPAQLLRSDDSVFIGVTPNIRERMILPDSNQNVSI